MDGTHVPAPQQSQQPMVSIQKQTGGEPVDIDISHGQMYSKLGHQNIGSAVKGSSRAICSNEMQSQQLNNPQSGTPQIHGQSTLNPPPSLLTTPTDAKHNTSSTGITPKSSNEGFTRVKPDNTPKVSRVVKSKSLGGHKYHPGRLVFARCQTWPWWPAVVMPRRGVPEEIIPDSCADKDIMRFIPVVFFSSQGLPIEIKDALLRVYTKEEHQLLANCWGEEEADLSWVTSKDIRPFALEQAEQDVAAHNVTSDAKQSLLKAIQVCKQLMQSQSLCRHDTAASSDSEGGWDFVMRKNSSGNAMDIDDVDGVVNMSADASGTRSEHGAGEHSGAAQGGVANTQQNGSSELDGRYAMMEPWAPQNHSACRILGWRWGVEDDGDDSASEGTSKEQHALEGLAKLGGANDRATKGSGKVKYIREFLVKPAKESYKHSSWLAQSVVEKQMQAEFTLFTQLPQYDGLHTFILSLWEQHAQAQKYLARCKSVKGPGWQVLVQWTGQESAEATWEREADTGIKLQGPRHQLLSEKLRKNVVSALNRGAFKANAADQKQRARAQCGGGVQHVRGHSIVASSPSGQHFQEGVFDLLQGWSQDKGLVMVNGDGLARQQSITSFLQLLRYEYQVDKPSLIIVSPELAKSWCTWMQLSSDQGQYTLNCVKYTGSVQARQLCQKYELQLERQYRDVWDSADEYKVPRGSDMDLAQPILMPDVVIASWDVVIEDQQVFKNIEWECVVVDQVEPLATQPMLQQVYQILPSIVPQKHFPVVLLPAQFVLHGLTRQDSLAVLDFVLPQDQSIPNGPGKASSGAIVTGADGRKYNLGEDGDRVQYINAASVVRTRQLLVEKQLASPVVVPIVEMVVPVGPSHSQLHDYMALLQDHKKELVGQPSAQQYSDLITSLKGICSARGSLSKLVFENELYDVSMIQNMSGKLLALHTFTQCVGAANGVGHVLIVCSEESVQVVATYLRGKWGNRSGIVSECGVVLSVQDMNPVRGLDSIDLLLITPERINISTMLPNVTFMLILDSSWNPRDDIVACARAGIIGQQGSQDQRKGFVAVRLAIADSVDMHAMSVAESDKQTIQALQGVPNAHATEAGVKSLLERGVTGLVQTFIDSSSQVGGAGKQVTLEQASTVVEVCKSWIQQNGQLDDKNQQTLKDKSLQWLQNEGLDGVSIINWKGSEHILHQSETPMYCLNSTSASATQSPGVEQWQTVLDTIDSKLQSMAKQKEAQTKEKRTAIQSITGPLPGDMPHLRKTAANSSDTGALLPSQSPNDVYSRHMKHGTDGDTKSARLRSNGTTARTTPTAHGGLNGHNESGDDTRASSPPRSKRTSGTRGQGGDSGNQLEDLLPPALKGRFADADSFKGADGGKGRGRGALSGLDEQQQKRLILENAMEADRRKKGGKRRRKNDGDASGKGAQDDAACDSGKAGNASNKRPSKRQVMDKTVVGSSSWHPTLLKQIQTRALVQLSELQQAELIVDRPGTSESAALQAAMARLNDAVSDLGVCHTVHQAAVDILRASTIQSVRQTQCNQRLRTNEVKVYNIRAVGIAACLEIASRLVGGAPIPNSALQAYFDVTTEGLSDQINEVESELLYVYQMRASADADKKLMSDGASKQEMYINEAISSILDAKAPPQGYKAHTPFEDPECQEPEFPGALDDYHNLFKQHADRITGTGNKARYLADVKKLQMLIEPVQSAYDKVVQLHNLKAWRVESITNLLDGHKQALLDTCKQSFDTALNEYRNLSQPAHMLVAYLSQQLMDTQEGLHGPPDTPKNAQTSSSLKSVQSNTNRSGRSNGRPRANGPNQAANFVTGSVPGTGGGAGVGPLGGVLGATAGGLQGLANLQGGSNMGLDPSLAELLLSAVGRGGAVQGGGGGAAGGAGLAHGMDTEDMMAKGKLGEGWNLPLPGNLLQQGGPTGQPAALQFGFNPNTTTPASSVLPQLSAGQGNDVLNQLAPLIAGNQANAKADPTATPEATVAHTLAAQVARSNTGQGGAFGAQVPLQQVLPFVSNKLTAVDNSLNKMGGLSTEHDQRFGGQQKQEASKPGTPSQVDTRGNMVAGQHGRQSPHHPNARGLENLSVGKESSDESANQQQLAMLALAQLRGGRGGVNTLNRQLLQVLERQASGDGGEGKGGMGGADRSKSGARGGSKQPNWLGELQDGELNGGVQSGLGNLRNVGGGGGGGQSMMGGVRRDGIGMKGMWAQGQGGNAEQEGNGANGPDFAELVQGIRRVSNTEDNSGVPNFGGDGQRRGGGGNGDSSIPQYVNRMDGGSVMGQGRGGDGAPDQASIAAALNAALQAQRMDGMGDVGMGRGGPLGGLENFLNAQGMQSLLGVIGGMDAGRGRRVDNVYVNGGGDGADGSGQGAAQNAGRRTKGN